MASWAWSVPPAWQSWPGRMPGKGKLLELQMEDALLNNLRAFFLGLGKGFAFVAREHLAATPVRFSAVMQGFFIHLAQ